LNKKVAIDCLTESSKRYNQHEAAIVIDVIRSTTVASTVVETGRRCFFAPNVEEAVVIAKQLDNPLLMGEIGGNMPYGFDLKNSPVDLQEREERIRPIVLVSSSGIPLLASLKGCNSLFIACLRNWTATVNQLSTQYNYIYVLAAPTRGEFREEDKLCCAWITAELLNLGYKCADKKTENMVNEWKNQPVEICGKGNSAKYLRDTGQKKDLDFILTHVNDFNCALTVKGNEIVKLSI
jgi:2-phosphosulfolactate phosphatase